MNYRAALSHCSQVVFLLVAVCSSWANGQEPTPADPFGLTAFGFEHKLDSRPVIIPSTEPLESRACSKGVYLKELTATVNKEQKKIKVVIIYFLPNPSTLRTFDDDLNKGTASALKLTNLPPTGTSSVMFFWSPRLRSVQQVLFMRAEKINDVLIGRALEFHAKLNVQESDSPSILWTFDNFIPRSAPPEILGNRIVSDDVMLKIFLPRGSRKCIEGK